MKHNIIQMTATADLTVPQSINLIFSTFSIVKFGLQSHEYQLRFHVSRPQSSLNVQRGQITALRRPIGNRISADYSIFENAGKKIDCYVGCVARRPVLLQPNVVHIVHRHLNDDVWISWAPNATVLLIDLMPKQSKMYWKIGLIE